MVYTGYRGYAPQQAPQIEEQIAQSLAQPADLGKLGRKASYDDEIANMLTQGAMQGGPKTMWEGVSQLGQAWIANKARKRADNAHEAYGKAQIDNIAAMIGPDATEQQLAAARASPDAVTAALMRDMFPTQAERQAAEGFTLSQGQTRFDAQGNPIASGGTEAPERKILKGADGYNYYQDTGERVLPGVVAEENGPMVTVNTGNMSDGRPIVGTPPKDHEYVWDEETGQYRARVIPGSETAREQEVLNSKAFQSLQANQEQFDAIMGNIDAADELIGVFTAGAGSYMEGIRGTPARDLAARLETVKANIGFDKLNEMRQTSPTGGALGQVTERELKFLQSVRGSLDAGQSPEQLRQTLSEIKASLQRLQEVREIAFKLEQSAVPEGVNRPQITPSEPLVQDDLPEGFSLVQ